MLWSVADLRAQNDTDKNRKQNRQTQSRTPTPQPSNNGTGKQKPMPEEDGFEAPQFKPVDENESPFDFEWGERGRNVKEKDMVRNGTAVCGITITDAQTRCTGSNTYAVDLTIDFIDNSSAYIININDIFYADGMYCGSPPCVVSVTGLGSNDGGLIEIVDGESFFCSDDTIITEPDDCCPQLGSPTILEGEAVCGDMDVTLQLLDTVNVFGQEILWQDVNAGFPFSGSSVFLTAPTSGCDPIIYEFYAFIEESNSCSEVVSDMVSITVYPTPSLPDTLVSVDGCTVQLVGDCVTDSNYTWTDNNGVPGTGPYLASGDATSLTFFWNPFPSSGCSLYAFDPIDVNCTPICPSFTIGNYSLPTSGITQHDLWNATVQNNEATSMEVEANLIIHEGPEVYNATTNAISIPAGQSINLSENLSLATSTASGAVGTALSNAGILPSGNYTVTLTVIPNGDVACAKVDTFGIMDLQKLTPPIPIAPYMDEQVKLDLPVFVWKPSAPVEADNYIFKIAEIIGSQSPQQAIAVNTLWHRHKINPRSQLEYPGNARPLESGKRYAWQMTANKTDMSESIVESAESEVWQFTYLGPKTVDELEEEKPLSGRSELICSEITEQTRLRVYGDGGNVGAQKVKATLSAPNSVTGLPWTYRVRYELLVNGGERVKLGELSISAVEPVAVNEFFEPFFTDEIDKNKFDFGGVELRVYDIYTIPQNPNLLPDEICLELSVKDAQKRYEDLDEELRSNAIYPNEAAYILLYYLNPRLNEEVPIASLKPLKVPGMDMRKRNAIASQKYIPTKRVDQSLNSKISTNNDRLEQNVNRINSSSRKLIEQTTPNGMLRLEDLEEFLRQLQSGEAFISNPSAIMLNAQMDYLNELLEKVNAGKNLSEQEKEDLRDLILGTHYMAEAAETSIKTAMRHPDGLLPDYARASISPDVAAPYLNEPTFGEQTAFINRGETDQILVNIGTYSYPGCEPKCELFFNYMPKGLYSVRERFRHVMKEFDAQTTNTHDFIPVGLYKIWLTDGENNEIALANPKEGELEIKIAGNDEAIASCKKSTTNAANTQHNDFHVNCPSVPAIMTAPPVVEDVYELNVVLFIK